MYVLPSSSFVPVPSECLLRQTGAGKVPPGSGDNLPASCNTTITDYANKMGCCSRIMNSILAATNLIGGPTGFESPSCVDDVLDIKLELSGLLLEEAQALVSSEALTQMSSDELAHLLPALLIPDFIRNVRLVSKNTRDDTTSVDVSIEFDVHPHFDPTLMF